MFNKKFLITYKVFFALLGLAAITQEIIVLVDRGTYNFINFWSYFTNQSNLFTAITLLVTAYMLAKGIKSKNWILFRGAASLYMVITGVVFAVLLSGGDPNTLTAVPIDNTILHQIIPIALLLDWLLDPPQKRIGFKRGLVWIAYPLIYAALALIRGANSGFYPYPFLNPANGGYGSVLVTAIGITLFVAAATWLMTRLPLKAQSRR
jgi:hypothetical protein